MTVETYIFSLLDNHPLQIALRTYTLSLSLSLGPALFSAITSRRLRRGRINAIRNILARDFGPTGFPLAMTIAVGGGAALADLWKAAAEGKRDCDTFTHSPTPYARSSLRSVRRWLLNVKDEHKTLIANILSSSLAIALLQWKRHSSSKILPSLPLTVPVTSSKRASPTLDLTLLFFVRAIDATVQSTFFRRLKANRNLVLSDDFHLEEDLRLKALVSQLDAFAFWGACARIMWCFFYLPERLPRSYVIWITSLANMDKRLLFALRALRSGSWRYSRGSPTETPLLTTMAQDLGYPSTWGDPSILPAYGGNGADKVWKALGVNGRAGVGGLPCEIVHGGIAGDSCVGNAGVRWLQAFVKAVAIYLPVHFLPILLTRPRSLLRLRRIFSTLFSVVRSASFLSTFVSSIWFAVCMTRTLAVARLFPNISHNVLDGPMGCIMAGCLACGTTISIEKSKRRGEMALYVLPRAIRSCLSDAWVRSGNRSVKIAERVVFILSLSILLTVASHRPESLRGLSRWTLAFVMKGPNAGFWKRKRQSTSGAVTPSPLDPSINKGQLRSSHNNL